MLLSAQQSSRISNDCDIVSLASSFAEKRGLVSIALSVAEECNIVSLVSVSLVSFSIVSFSIVSAFASDFFDSANTADASRVFVLVCAAPVRRMAPRNF